MNFGLVRPLYTLAGGDSHTRCNRSDRGYGLRREGVLLFWTPRANSLRPGKTIQVSVNGRVSTLWRVNQTHTTPYHPQSNGVVERGNRVLGDALRALLLDRGQEDWDLVLPQLL